MKGAATLPCPSITMLVSPPPAHLVPLAWFHILQRHWTWNRMDETFRDHTTAMGDVHHYAWRANAQNESVYLRPRDAARCVCTPQRYTPHSIVAVVFYTRPFPRLMSTMQPRYWNLPPLPHPHLRLSIPLHCIPRLSIHCTALSSTALHCTALHCTALHCTALSSTALHCTPYQTGHSFANWTREQCLSEDCTEAATRVDIAVDVAALAALLDDVLPAVFAGATVRAAARPWPEAV